MHASSRFLAAALGRAGASALQALAKAEPELLGYLVPRAALAWLGRAAGGSTELPGCPEVGMALRRSASGWHGLVVVDGVTCDLEAAEPAHVAAAISCAVGVTPSVVAKSDRDLARLGHTIDLLAKAQAKRPDVEGTGSVASPIGPLAPAAPTPTAPDSSRKNRRIRIPLAPKAAEPPKPRTAPLALSERDAARKCTVCGAGQFQNGKFRGCYCIRSMVKSIEATPRAGGRWDIRLDRLAPDEASLVIELFKGPANGR